MTQTLGDSLNRRIKEQLIDKVSALPSVAKCYGFEKLPLEQFPSVIIRYASLDGEFSTTTENRRIYSYTIRILYEIGKDLNTIQDDRLQYADEAVAQVVEEIANDLDSDFELDQFNANVLYMRALDVVYTDYSYEGGYASGAELSLQVITDYDT